ncbi:non-ribosomal peptide synthetase [Pseudoalteromonas sp. S2755]|uniref:non-ribosomal peptide synthetase n=1 Tax=Pseudoalteromonas sp. S2755 TaxID=2066523 RepID=UPI00110C1832|nr:non-ribosomal peptide synthetase [Pseudoalteromonas sp. S2755]TMN45133.1 non-ribosomal peptide synthetase [Pseudoalteromonas sp. S2755]
MRLAELFDLLASKGVVLSCQNGQLLLEGNVSELSESEIALLRERKQEIIALSGAKNSVFDINTIARGETYTASMSSHQKSMYLLESLAQQSYYNLPVAYKIVGKLNVHQLQHAFSTLVEQHHVLRTVYVEANNTQQVQPMSDFVLSHTKLDCESELQHALQVEANYRFDLTAEWPIRAHVFELSDYSVLSINVHHIAADGFSAKIILQTLSDAYAKGDVQHYPVQAQYADFSEWQQQYLNSEAGKEGVAYWRTLLQGAPSCHNFPLQKQRPAGMTVKGKRTEQLLSPELSSAIKVAAKQHGVSRFSMLQSLFACFLSRMSDSQDVVFGSVYANRGCDNVGHTVGMFANTLPFRFQFSAEDGLADALQQCKGLVQQAKQHQYIPFDEIVKCAEVEYQSNHLPLVQIMLVAQDNALEQFELEDCQVEFIKNEQEVSKFDFSIHVFTKGKQLAFVWEYNTELFSQKWIVQLGKYFEQFIATLISAPERAFAKVDFVATDDMTLATVQDFPCFKSLPELIAEQAQTSRECIAVRHHDDVLTYESLEDCVSRSAGALLQRGYAPGCRVGVCMDKSIEMVISMLAIMRAGLTYVPIDPSYPQARIAQICSNAELSCIVTAHGEFDVVLEDWQPEIVAISQLLQGSKPTRLPVLAADDIAYVLYTSGSTGVPKGVAVPHGSIFYSIEANRNVFGFSASDSMPTIGSQAFGVSLLEILVPLLSGGGVEIVSREDVSLIPNLVERTQNVSVLHAVPSLMSPWIDEVLHRGDSCYPALRLLLVGGEPVPEALLKKLRDWRPDVEIRVLYGMTESSVVSSSYDARRVESLGYCIGQPHPNVNYYVMNPYGARQPDGVSGELCVAGLSLAAGYVNNVEQSNKHFVFEQKLAQRIYKTGDRAKRNSDGYYEFYGRLDNQISLRGVRIELGDIESCVNLVHAVKSCVVHPQTINDTETVLVLYFCLRDEADEKQVLAQIKAQMDEQLPASMRPTLFSCLDALPLNANGKVDRKSLPIPQLQSDYVEPETATEVALQGLWSELFEMPEISVEGNFFELGGHSLLASKLVAKSNALFSIDLSIASFMTSPTIRLCAKQIDLELDKQKMQQLSAAVVDQTNNEELVF